MKLPRMSVAACALVAVTAVAWPRDSAIAQQPPNIVYIVSDDQGWKDVGYHGSPIHTPNIDELAATGARMEQFYAQPMCTPTRAALMTGRYPFRYGLQTAVIASNHTYGLSTEEWLLPQALKEAGYETAIVGKWHLGHADPKYWPRQRGFDHQYGPLIGEIDYFTHKQHGVIDWYRDNKQVDEPGYSTTLLGNDAVQLIEGHDTAKPLYLYLTFNAAHTPYQAPQDYLDQYKTIEDPSRQAYAAQITAMDDQIGRVVAALDEKGMRDNTLIVFQSDNGGTNNPMFAGEGDMSKIKIPVDNGPYRDGKASLYEGGTRVISLANWPGKIKPGTVVDGMIHVVDMYPTLVDLAGGKFDKNKPLDGVDVWPAIAEGAPSPRTEIIYNIEPFRAGVREGDWKLIWRTPLPQSVELYNIADDPYEKNDVAAAHPDTVATLEKRANELAATAAKPLFLATEFQAMRDRLALPPALPKEEWQLDGAD
ncbi:arylsulfatase [Kaistia dalseonensis]|uniref:Arylsulfatase A-like enzyme n=1 Tax=Kaistia dalseonensis TaxID=410840 RepID=A0ABU0HAI8_9HYPH|nr:arylsulfatase [Kaistia dalseonensis]MCX5496703.1 arylsulfatase [Kaistia dalseonensis]MDQ0439329.1 arylsulfatase A-like enzyme [Kaistia dalseonensis]